MEIGNEDINFLLLRPKEMQEIVLIHPGGLTKLNKSLLSSQNSEEDEEVLLLVLIQLTEENDLIQIWVAHKLLNHLFTTIKLKEQNKVIVRRCFQLLTNLLKGNASNQTLFCQGLSI